MTSSDELHRAYRSSLDDDWLRLSRVAALVALVLVPAGVTLDLLVYPERLREFAWLRLSCDLFIALALLLSFTRSGSRYRRELTFIWMLGIQVMIGYMIRSTDGPISPYYAGLNLAVLAVGIFLPASVRETFFFAGSTLAFYLVAVAPIDYSDERVGILYSNLYFLILTAVVTLFASYFGGRRRFEEFRLSFELDRRNRELAELDRTKSEFFANISHELRTPLTLILSPVQDILETQCRLPERVATALGTVRNNAWRLLKLVNDLLDVIRLEEGKTELGKEPVAIDPLVGAVSDAMMHLAEMQGVELRVCLGAGDRLVEGDAAALEKVLINLLNNAIKFSVRGGVVEARTSLQGDLLRIEVSDTGIGIAESELPHIFERFRQADGSSARRFKGTGLGLALVRDIVERHSGSVGVASVLGEGTTLTVDLPLGPCQESEGSTQRDALPVGLGIQRIHRLAEANAGISAEADDEIAQASDAGCPDDRLPRLLVVDDEPDMRRYLVSMLSDDYCIVQASSGPDGLRIARDLVPDLMLLDLMLPELDGLEVCRCIKADERTRCIRIVLLTARVDEEAKLTALRHGADDFVTKPFSRLEVRSRLANLYRSARLERDLAVTNDSLRVALRDLQLAQAQLIQSEKLNALGSLSAGLLHEINNPLNYSLTALQLLGADPTVRGNPLLGEIVSDIDEGMQRIRTIVGDLRAFAYPTEAERQCPFDLRESVEAARRFAAAELKGVELVCRLGDDARVLGSKSHLTQVFINLFVNAARAIGDAPEPRGGRISVDGEMHSGRLWVRVCDNGVGMDEETLTRIFDPFFTTRDVGEGMGLGLSVCHTIVTNHHGRLTAFSRLGEGTEMTFDLTLAEGAVR